MLAHDQAPSRIARPGLWLRSVALTGSATVLVASLVMASSLTAPRPPAPPENRVAAAPAASIAAAAASTPTVGPQIPGATVFSTASQPPVVNLPSTAPAQVKQPASTPAPTPVPNPVVNPTANPPANPTPNPTPKPTPKPTAPPPPPPPPPSGVHLSLGVWSGQPWDSTALHNVATLIGGAPAVYLTYVSFNRPWYKSDEQAIYDMGAAHVITWEPRNCSGSCSLKSLAAGTQDTFIRAWAKGAAAWGKTIYLRPMHEMNGDWYPWGRGVNGNTAADFVAAWRHMHDVFKQEGATKVKWVWCPNVRYGKEYPFADLYPGSSYVDWTCLDGYNWGTDPHLGQPAWQSFATIFGSTYSQVMAIAPSKPMMIGEMASTEHGGNKADWIRKTYLTDILKYPAIKVVVWFNQADGASDFRINSSTAARDAFRDVYDSSTWSGNLYRG